MNKIHAILILSLISTPKLFAQHDNSSLKIFGYFQSLASYETALNTFQGNDQPTKTSFSLQQLNIFFQKDITDKWRALVNVEFVNNFSSSRKWGSVDLDEAWIRYRANAHFNLKLGLLVPVFNNLNEIKNKTPLLPYIIRPIAYETSFENFIPVDEFLPSSAFVQIYGFLGVDKLKFDYAFFAGNTSNINTNPEFGQTGVDTTAALLFGGRVGLRANELKFGISFTKDNLNGNSELQRELALFPSISLHEVPRIRLGSDLSYYTDKFSFESEIIRVVYDDDIDGAGFNKYFYYTTFGYRFHERFFAYFTYWNLFSDLTDFAINENQLILTKGESDMRIPGFGLTYNLNERTVLKAQFATIAIDTKIKSLGISQEANFNYYALAASVYF